MGTSTTLCSRCKTPVMFETGMFSSNEHQTSKGFLCRICLLAEDANRRDRENREREDQLERERAAREEKSNKDVLARAAAALAQSKKDSELARKSEKAAARRREQAEEEERDSARRAQLDADIRQQDAEFKADDQRVARGQAKLRRATHLLSAGNLPDALNAVLDAEEILGSTSEVSRFHLLVAVASGDPQRLRAATDNYVTTVKAEIDGLTIPNRNWKGGQLKETITATPEIEGAQGNVREGLAQLLEQKLRKLEGAVSVEENRLRTSVATEQTAESNTQRIAWIYAIACAVALFAEWGLHTWSFIVIFIISIPNWFLGWFVLTLARSDSTKK